MLYQTVIFGLHFEYELTKPTLQCQNLVSPYIWQYLFIHTEILSHIRGKVKIIVIVFDADGLVNLQHILLS